MEKKIIILLTIALILSAIVNVLSYRILPDIGQVLKCETKMVSSNTLRCREDKCDFDEYPKKFCWVEREFETD